MAGPRSCPWTGRRLPERASGRESPVIVDSHCHLAGDAFAQDLEDVVARCRAASITEALCVLAAGDADEAGRADQLSRIWPDVRFAIGVHPHQAADFDGRTQASAVLVQSEIKARTGACAIGEIGLDYHYDFAPRHTQREVFGTQLALARTLNLPVVIHTREADPDTMDVLRSEGGGVVKGVLHCFTGSEALARQALDLDFHISFAGILTFAKAGNLREIARLVPANRLLAETDSPFLAPVPYRGKRNEPAWVTRTIAALAEVRGSTVEDVDRQTTANFRALFGD